MAETSSLHLLKQGDGTLTLTDDSAFAGNVTVNGGTLAVNGNLGANNVSVDFGATVGGTGTVKDLANVGGFVAPGNSVGTLGVSGDFLQVPSGTLNIEFDNTGIDKLDVTGTATLAGSVRFIELASGTTLNTPFTFLEGRRWNQRHLGGKQCLFEWLCANKFNGGLHHQRRHGDF